MMVRKSVVFVLLISFVMILFACLTACSDSGGGGGSSSPQKLTLSNFQAASVVIGQSDFVSNSSASSPTASAFEYDISGNPAVYNGILYLPDTNYCRVMGYNSIPETNGASADFVLGWNDFTTPADGCTETLMDEPFGLCVYDGKLFVTDYGNYRILIYDNAPDSTPGSADVAVGQADLTSDAFGATAYNLGYVESVSAAGGKLVVADRSQHRVLIWNSIPATHGAFADIVLGQSDFTSSLANAGGSVSASTLNSPTAVWTDGTMLIVNDSNNNRVLIWNTFPTANFAEADVVLGQSDFTHNTNNDYNQDGTTDGFSTDRTLNGPVNGLFCYAGQLFVTDTYNNRVLIWNEIPAENFTPADVILGQSEDYLNASNDDDQDGSSDAGATARTLNYPNGICVYENKLIVGDMDNNRYLIYESE